MITLYSFPGACSLATHIVIQELGLPYQLKLLGKETPDIKAEIKKWNPTGQVPTLVTEEGYGLAEGAAIMQYLITKKPNTLFPASGQQRFKAFEWMNFISSALHKGFTPLFNPSAFSTDESHFDAIRKTAGERMKGLLQITEDRFSNNDFSLGNDFTIVDAYLYVVLSWSASRRIDLAPYKKLSSFMERMAKRPAVIAARKAEGLPV